MIYLYEENANLNKVEIVFDSKVTLATRRRYVEALREHLDLIRRIELGERERIVSYLEKVGSLDHEYANGYLDAARDIKQIRHDKD